MKENQAAAIILVLLLVSLSYFFIVALGIFFILGIFLSIVFSAIISAMIVVRTFKRLKEKERSRNQIIISLLIVVVVVSLSFTFQWAKGGDIGFSSERYKSKPRVSSGYKDEYTPTIDKKGDYHTIDGDGKQIQYQGSKEQKDDLKAIDEYAKDNPGF